MNKSIRFITFIFIIQIISYTNSFSPLSLSLHPFATIQSTTTTTATFHTCRTFPAATTSSTSSSSSSSVLLSNMSSNTDNTDTSSKPHCENVLFVQCGYVLCLMWVLFLIDTYVTCIRGLDYLLYLYHPWCRSFQVVFSIMKILHSLYS